MRKPLNIIIQVMNSKYAAGFKNLYLEKYQSRRKQQESWRKHHHKQPKNSIILTIQDTNTIKSKTINYEWPDLNLAQDEAERKTIFMPSSFKFKITRRKQNQPSNSLDHIKQQNLQRQRDRALQGLNTHIHTIIKPNKPDVKTVQKLRRDVAVENQTEMKISRCSTHRRNKSETTYTNSFRICLVNKEVPQQILKSQKSPNIDIKRKMLIARTVPLKTEKKQKSNLKEQKNFDLRLETKPKRSFMDIKPWEAQYTQILD